MSISFIILIGLILIMLVDFLCFDRLLKTEYEKHKEQWIKDGKPRGYFWWPYESPLFTGYIAQLRLTIHWLFKTPQWIKHDVKARKTLQINRICTLIVYVGILVVVINELRIN